MPLVPNLFIETQCFVEQCAEECPEIKQAMFLYQTRLCQISIDRSAMRALFNFVTEHLIPHALAEELQPEMVPL
jgi:hypothetical protein